jgi:hypothetical protein
LSRSSPPRWGATASGFLGLPLAGLVVALPQQPELHEREQDDGEEQQVAGGGGVAEVAEAELVEREVGDRAGRVERAALGHHEGLLEELEVADAGDHRAEQQHRPQHGQGDVAEPSPPRGAVDLGGLVHLLGDGLETGQEDDHQGAEVPPRGHHDQGRERQRRAVEPGRPVQADPRQHGVEDTAVVAVQVLPHDGDGDDAGHDGQVIAHAEEALEPDDAVEEHGHPEGERHGERHAQHQVEQRVDGDLAEDRVLDQLHVVVEPDELDGERRPDVGPPHVGEAHAEAGQHRTQRERQEQQGERQREHPRGKSLLASGRVDVAAR